jgi:hypothetical protein
MLDFQIQVWSPGAGTGLAQWKRIHDHLKRYIIVSVTQYNLQNRLSQHLILIIQQPQIYAQHISCNVTIFSYHHSVIIQHLISDTLYIYRISHTTSRHYLITIVWWYNILYQTLFIYTEYLIQRHAIIWSHSVMIQHLISNTLYIHRIYHATSRHYLITIVWWYNILYQTLLIYTEYIMQRHAIVWSPQCDDTTS